MIKVLILGLLNKFPMHGYRIKDELEKGNYEIWANININSIYNALKTLQKSGCITMQEIIQKGNQTKSVYNITEKGNKEYKSLLSETISSSKTVFPGDLYVGLSFISDMSEQEGLEVIEMRLKSLQQQMDNWHMGRSKKCKQENEPFLSKLFDNGISHLQSDYNYLLFIKDNFSDYRNYILQTEKEYIRTEHDKN